MRIKIFFPSTPITSTQPQPQSTTYADRSHRSHTEIMSPINISREIKIEYTKPVKKGKHPILTILRIFHLTFPFYYLRLVPSFQAIRIFIVTESFVV